MPRSLSEWIGRTPDTPVPPRVRWRVFQAAKRRCAHCLRRLRIGTRFTCDHAIALINGGENRDPIKSAADVKDKAKVYRAGSKQFRGFRQTHKPLPGSRASGIRGRMNGTVEAWQ